MVSKNPNLKVYEEDLSIIRKNVKYLKYLLPQGIMIVAAVKTRTAEEMMAAINSGINTIGHNYVQEAEKMKQTIGNHAEWHMIGHLQSNKVKKAVRIFDVIETIDSLKIAEAVNSECEKIGKIMPVMIEINSGEESNKTGVMPEYVDDLVVQIARLKNLKIEGLMTMGPRFGDPENARPYFKITKTAFERIKEKKIPNVNMHYLSMGMSNSYKIALEEGANLIRIGTLIFGERCY